ncbi:MAG: hypothetical protein QGG96_03045 [Candidatus Poseidoniaceae archaeon]|jgi:hypothetical protein|nr:hypothetical protein [Candidatus Poseidoniaceae archaeon]
MGDVSVLIDGERIPRRPLPQFDEVEGGMLAAVAKDGVLGTALEDKNQYGPHMMIVLLMVTATLTGGIILAIQMF